MIPSGAIDVFGEDKMKEAQGFKAVVYSLAFGITLPLSGYLLDNFDSMNIPVIIVGSMQTISGPLILIVSYLVWRDKLNSCQGNNIETITSNSA